MIDGCGSYGSCVDGANDKINVGDLTETASSMCSHRPQQTGSFYGYPQIKSRPTFIKAVVLNVARDPMEGTN